MNGSPDHLSRWRLSDGTAPSGPKAGPGWRIARCTPPSRLFGANGIQIGPDGRLYVAQTFGSQISAVRIADGTVDPVMPAGGPITAPDDVAFDSRGVLYATEVMSARVSAREPGGRTRVVAEGLPSVNGITVWRDRLFVDECRPNGRLLELDPSGARSPRILAHDLAAPNALMVGPDERLYFPLVGAGEIWRITPEGRGKERVIGGLALPMAVKFDSRGDLLVVESGSGEIARIDVRCASKTTVARVAPGMDNLALDPADHLFVSHFFDGRITEIGADGGRVVVPGGFLGPWGLAAASDGALWISDGGSLAVLNPDGDLLRAGTLLHHSFPGFIRGVAIAAPDSVFLTTSAGTVSQYHSRTGLKIDLAAGLTELYDLAVTHNGSLLVSEGGTGRLLEIDVPSGDVSEVALGLRLPTGIALSDDGVCFVAESEAGRVVAIREGKKVVVAEGFQMVQGLCVCGDALFALDVGARTLHTIPLESGTPEVVAWDLPVGPLPGTSAKPLPGVPDAIPGPLTSFAGVAAARDGTIWISANGEGSILALKRQHI